MTTNPLDALQAALSRARALCGDLDRTDRDTDRQQVASGVRHEIDTALRQLRAYREELAALATANRPGAVRADAPATSRAAAKSVQLRTGNAVTRVLSALYYAHDGLTDHEIQSQLRMRANTERPRRGELVDDGLVAASGRTRVHDGQEWNVWAITTKGEAAYRTVEPGAPPRTTPGHQAAAPTLF